MDFIEGYGQGASIWLAALGLGVIAAAIMLLRLGAKRRRSTESGQPQLMLGMGALVLGTVLFVPGIIWFVMALSDG
ncbi:hypothetical protein [Agrococcus sp. ProA11]|uniref:hypothetical protein n=1 Tax=Agrococcus chionoecetis TaxID=3153752 RepID=UPI003261925D